MSSWLISILVAGLLLAANTVAVSAQEAAQVTDKVTPDEMIRAEFRISGTDCPICLNRIKEKIDAVKGVKKSSVWLWRPYYGMVVYDPKVTNWKSVEKAVEVEHVEFSDLVQQHVRAEPEKQDKKTKAEDPKN